MDTPSSVQLTQPPTGLRADRSCTPLAERPLTQSIPSPATATLDPRGGRSWTDIHRAGSVIDPSFMGVHTTTMPNAGSDYVGAVQGKGDRLGLLAWSPPV